MILKEKYRLSCASILFQIEAEISRRYNNRPVKLIGTGLWPLSCDFPIGSYNKTSWFYLVCYANLPVFTVLALKSTLLPLYLSILRMTHSISIPSSSYYCSARCAPFPSSWLPNYIPSEWRVTCHCSLFRLLVISVLGGEQHPPAGHWVMASINQQAHRAIPVSTACYRACCSASRQDAMACHILNGWNKRTTLQDLPEEVIRVHHLLGLWLNTAAYFDALHYRLITN